MIKYLQTITAILLLIANSTVAQPGTLDPDFDVDGIVKTNFGNMVSNNPTNDLANSMVLTPDGKIVVGGTSNNLINGKVNFAAARYNWDGSLDYSFGNIGTVTYDVKGAYNQHQTGLGVQSDGKVVVAGVYDYTSVPSSYNEFALVRFKSDGTIDSSFGTNGLVTTLIGYECRLYSLVIQPDDKILVAGYSVDVDGSYYTLARYNTNGSLDYSFSFNGIVTIRFQGSGGVFTSMTLQPDGKILAADIDFRVARFNTDGFADVTFDGDGLSQIAINASDYYASSIALQPDGRILVGGYINDNLWQGQFGFVRYLTDGRVDSTFGINGVSITPLSGTDNQVYSIATQPDGKFLAVGYAKINNKKKFSVARFNSDGSFDNSFDTDGKLSLSFALVPADESATAVVLEPDGRVLVAGWAYPWPHTTNDDFVLVRLLSGLNLGVIEFHQNQNSVLVYPNPLSETAILEYTLQSREVISIDLTDVQGRLITNLIIEESQEAGKHEQKISLPKELGSGAYLLSLSSTHGKITIRLIK